MTLPRTDAAEPLLDLPALDSRKLIHNPGIGFRSRGYAHALDVMIIAM
jgi:hypothetical protein